MVQIDMKFKEAYVESTALANKLGITHDELLAKAITEKQHLNSITKRLSFKVNKDKSELRFDGAQVNHIIYIYKAKTLAKEIIKEFKVKNEYITSILIKRDEAIKTRKELTSNTQKFIGNEEEDYSYVTNFCYLIAFQKSHKEVLEEIIKRECSLNGIAKENINIRDYFNDEELKRIMDIESEYATLLKYLKDNEKVELEMFEMYKGNQWNGF